MRFVQLWLLSLIVLSGTTEAQEQWFYNTRNYGSEALYNPLSLVLNGSFDIIQLQGHRRDIFRFPVGAGVNNVLSNAGNPFGPISRYGWGDFLSNEVLPITIAKKGAQWWPNYQLHLIGGGMTYRATAEWYEARGIPSPRLMSLGTMAVYHLLNEAVENESYVGDNVDPIADLWIFDTGGIILFSSDAVCRFFSRTLNLADWSRQPSINIRDATLQNNGQYFSIRWKLPWQERFHVFYYFGMNGLVGVSYIRADGYGISAAAGLHAKQREIVDQATRQVSLDLVWNGGLFVDYNNSLLGSLTISGLTDDRATLNVYPGVIPGSGFSPGLWVQYQTDARWLFGLTTRWIPGIALSSK